MSRDTVKNLFIVSSMPRFYQQVLSGVGSYQELGNRVIRQIKAAHAFRQVEQVRELSSLLLNFPINEYQLIAQYYLAWCRCREKRYDNEALENIIDQTSTYKTKALISRAAFEGYQMNFEREFYFYTEASKSRPTISEHIDISKSIAVIKAKEGFHKSALRELEYLIPSIRYAELLVYFDVLNSYSIELAEAGRKDEARNVIRHVVASPFASAYPEWLETARDLKGPDHSFIAAPLIERMPVEIEAKETHHANEQEPPGKVVTFPPLKEAPAPKKPEIIDSQQFADMSLADRREFLLGLSERNCYKRANTTV